MEECGLKNVEWIYKGHNNSQLQGLMNLNSHNKQMHVLTADVNKAATEFGGWTGNISHESVCRLKSYVAVSSCLNRASI